MWKWIFNPNAARSTGCSTRSDLIPKLPLVADGAGYQLPGDHHGQRLEHAALLGLVLLAALQAIPAELYDAAKVDRAPCGPVPLRHAALALATRS